MYSINFTVTKKKFCLSFHYNGANSYLFVNGTEIYKFRAKDSEIVASPLCLGNISKDWSQDNMIKTGLNGYVYEFNVDYGIYSETDFSEFISHIHNYLMAKYNVKWNKLFVFVKKIFYIGSLFSSSLVSTTSLNCISMKIKIVK